MTDPTETPTGELVGELERLYALPWGQDWDDKGWPHPGAIAAAARGAPRLVRELREARERINALIESIDLIAKEYHPEGQPFAEWSHPANSVRAARAWLKRWGSP